MTGVTADLTAFTGACISDESPSEREVKCGTGLL